MTDAKRIPIVQLIADAPPPKPKCFETTDDWCRWLVAAHEAGERVVRRVDVGRTRADRRAGRPGNRETHFEVLPLDRIDICKDCTAVRRARMDSAGRCEPPAAHALLKALKAGASSTVLRKLLESKPVDADLLRALFDVARADFRRDHQASAAAVKNDRARAHVRQAWTHHLEQVMRGRAEPMSKATFAAVMVASMRRDSAWNDSKGRPFSVTARQIERRWLPPLAGIAHPLPAKGIPTEPAQPAHQE